MEVQEELVGSERVEVWLLGEFFPVRDFIVDIDFVFVPSEFCMQQLSAGEE